MSANMETRRFLIYVVSLSIFLLLFSCFILFKSSTSSSLVPESVLMFMLVNNSSIVTSKHQHHALDQEPTLATTLIDNGKPIADTDLELIEQVEVDECLRSKERGLLRVYMYDLPSEFHFGLLGWKGRSGQVWPDVNDAKDVPSYPGGLNLQHSVEYWLTLDLLSSNSIGIDRPRTVIRVMNSRCADVIFVPFFASLSYNRHSRRQLKEKVSRNRLLQDKLVKFLLEQEEWKRSGGKDHVIVAHHPNSLLDARKKLGAAMFILADFGRYRAEVANLKKDLIAPYKHVVQTLGDDSPSFDDRPLLGYFQGAIHRKDGGFIRQELYQLLKDEKDVHFSYGSVQAHGISKAGQGMASSKYCFNIAGDTPSSNRLFDAIVSHCVPVIISDDIELPFEDVLDYSEFCVFVRASDAVKKDSLMNLLRGISRDKWTGMWQRLKQLAHHFEYQYPSEEGDAVQMIWKAIARKVPSVRLQLHKHYRFNRSDHPED
ncbi:putative xylogalacturonan beta-1,3-xylosyltransferase [Dioscorea sansibarensis]